MSFFEVFLLYFCMFGLCIHISCSFNKLFYKVSIDDIISFRRERLIRLRSRNFLRLQELKQNETGKNLSKIEKIENLNKKIMVELLDLERYSVKKD